MLIIHFIGLAMGVGTGIGFIFLGRATAKMEKSEAVKFTLNALALSKMGTIGLTLLVISGLYMITPYWSHLMEFPYLVTKLCLVLVLIILLLIIGNLSKQARKSTMPETYLNKIKKVSPFSLLTAIVIIIMAVLTFH